MFYVMLAVAPFIFVDTGSSVVIWYATYERCCLSSFADNNHISDVSQSLVTMLTLHQLYVGSSSSITSSRSLCVLMCSACAPLYIQV